jgi:hypothetical protein
MACNDPNAEDFNKYWETSATGHYIIHQVEATTDTTEYKLNYGLRSFIQNGFIKDGQPIDYLIDSTDPDNTF